MRDALKQSAAGPLFKKSYREKAGNFQNTVDPKDFFDTFALPRSGRDCRASRLIEGCKKFFEKRLTKRNDALRCKARNGGRQAAETAASKKSKDSVDANEKTAKLSAPQGNG
ncbi:MAG: hypothetical protein WCO68_05565 [Verrucomicrobiota bacterium]